MEYTTMVKGSHADRKKKKQIKGDFDIIHLMYGSEGNS